MIKLDKSQIAQILPEYLSERTEVKCLSFAINKAMQKFVNYCGDIGVFAMIDSAPDDVLDLLAVELNTQYYNTSLGIEVKRKLIKNTMVWYMTAGTPSAVEELVAAVFGDGNVLEWFEYGGQVYCFKIQTSAILREDLLNYFQRMIDKVKNLRSHMEPIEICRMAHQIVYEGTGIFSQYYRAAAVTDDFDA